MSDTIYVLPKFPKHINLDIKAKHIKKGIQCNSDYCAIALALNEYLGKNFPDFKHTGIMTSRNATIVIHKEGSPLCKPSVMAYYRLSKGVKFACDFDRNKYEAKPTKVRLTQYNNNENPKGELE